MREGIAGRVRAAIEYLSGQVERGREACRRADTEHSKLLSERSSLRDALEAAERRATELEQQCDARHLRSGHGVFNSGSALGLASPNVLESSPIATPNRMSSPILQLQLPSSPIGIHTHTHKVFPFDISTDTLPFLIMIFV